MSFTVLLYRRYVIMGLETSIDFLAVFVDFVRRVVLSKYRLLQQYGCRVTLTWLVMYNWLVTVPSIIFHVYVLCWIQWSIITSQGYLKNVNVWIIAASNGTVSMRWRVNTVIKADRGCL